MRGVAYVNHGRWIVDCPNCGSPVKVDPREGNEAVCGACVPGIFAVAYTKHISKGREIYRPTPDIEKREQSRQGKAFKFILPDYWQKIEAALKPRHISNMNWLPGETLDDLRAENLAHGVKEK